MANFTLKSDRMSNDTLVDAVDNHIVELEEQISIALVGDTSLVDAATAGPYVATAGHNHDAVYEVLGKGVTGGDAHNHVGGDGAQIDHTGLLNIGTNTHAQIDTFIGTTADLTYAPIAKGVTNGDSHDHAGGDGAAIVEAAITLDDNVTLDVSGTKHGLTPKLPAVSPTSKYLRGDGTWVTPPGLGETISEGDITLADVVTLDVSTSKHGLTPKAPNDVAKYLRGDGTWATIGTYDTIPTGTGPVKVTSGAFNAAAANIVESEITLADNTTLDVSGTKHGLVPKLPAADQTLKFLRGDGAFNVATVVESGITLADNTTGDVSITKHGFAPKAPNDVTKFLSGLGTWVVVDTEGTTPTGTGFRHVTAGVEDVASKLVENADVHASAGIVESKLSLNNPTHAAVTLGATATPILGLTTQEIGFDTQVKNYVLAGPTTGSDAAPTFRALVAADVPTHASSHKHGGADEVAVHTAAANSIPMTSSSSTLSIDWIPLGATSSTACIGNDARLPVAGEKSALAGTTGTPGSANKYVTDTDTRMTDSRTPSAHAASHLQGGSDTLHELLTPKAHQHTIFVAGLTIAGTLNTTNGDVVAGSGSLGCKNITATGAIQGATVTATGNISGVGITASGALSGATVVATGGFGCNTKTAQTAAAVSALPGTMAGEGFCHEANLALLRTLVGQIRTALIANGICV